MVNDYNEILIRFQFNFNGKLEIVYAQDIQTMELFLRQHNFLQNNQPIEEFYRLNLFYISTIWDHVMRLNDEELEKKDELIDTIPKSIIGRILKHFKFKSNNSKEDFIIISNDYLVANAIELTCHELTDSLIFGSVVTQTEIGFVSEICELIELLPKVNVLDFYIMDEYNGDDYSKDTSSNDQKKEYYQQYITLTNNVFAEDTLDEIPQGRFHDVGCYHVYKAFLEDCYIELTQPITIEAYINNLSKSLKGEV